jgi:hypothetical protein
MRISILGFLIIFISCASLKTEIISQKQITTLKEVVTSKNFEVISDWAQPFGLNAGMTGLQGLIQPGSSINNISLIGNPNFFKSQKDSVCIDLPYFGEQQMSRGHNFNGGIKFKGKVDNYKASFNEKKNVYTLKYWLKGAGESYAVILTMFANNNSTLSITSSHRTTINYIGNWKKNKKIE